MMQEMYTVTPKPKGMAKDKWDFIQLGAILPAAGQSLELLAPTQQENACTFA